MSGDRSKPEKKVSNVSTESRKRGCVYGLFIGDALAMPVHWYYDRLALQRDYGLVKDYLPPKNPHPDSILWRSSYKSINKKGDILHAGENTLNLKLCALLIESLNEKGEYDPEDYLKRYITYMTTPGKHRDTYVEEYHRHFFTQYAKGVPPRKCGVQEKHIGGLVGVIPILVSYMDDPEEGRKAALAHLSLTHLGPKMEDATSLLAGLLLQILNSHPLKEALMGEIGEQRSPFAGYPFLKWLDEADEWVVGRRFSTACYVEESVPSVIYLALKYYDDPEGGLIANTNLGGDNAYRGAVLGALLGAANGIEAFPERWIKGLRHPPPELADEAQGQKRN
jgi:ADP-ribosylglycohydrolase